MIRYEYLVSFRVEKNKYEMCILIYSHCNHAELEYGKKKYNLHVTKNVRLCIT